MKGPARRWTFGLWVAACPLLLLVAWTVAAYTGWPSPRAVPFPGEVADLAGDEMLAGALWRDLGATMARVGIGVGIATVIGTGLGAALGRSRRAWRAVEPTVDFLRAVPPLLVFPLLLLGFGYGDHARVVAVIFGTTGTVLIHVAGGLAHVPPGRSDMARLAGLRGWRAFQLLYFWETLPSLLTGVRIALTQGLVIATATEMLLGARSGLGARALQAQLAYRADLLWLVILIAGAAGFVLSGAVVALERRLAWSSGRG